MHDHIDLSNACRELYFTRVEKANITRENLNETLEMNESIAMNSMDIAMTELRTEMSGLMQQDVALMGQLLTMNEAVEDLKSRHRGYGRTERDSSRTIPSSSKIFCEETSPSSGYMPSFQFESTNIPCISGSTRIPAKTEEVEENFDYPVFKESHSNSAKSTERQEQSFSDEIAKQLKRHKTLNDLTMITEKSELARHKFAVKKVAFNSNDSGYCDSDCDPLW